MKHAHVTPFKTILALTLVAILLASLAGCTHGQESISNPSTIGFVANVASDRDNTNTYASQANAILDEYVYCQLKYTNRSAEPQQDIVIWADFPSNFMLLEDTTWYYDASHVDGIKIKNDITEGIQIPECKGATDGASEGETITIKFTLCIVEAPAEGENLVTPISGHLKVANAVCRSDASVIIPAA